MIDHNGPFDDPLAHLERLRRDDHFMILIEGDDTAMYATISEGGA
jgi:hypothetical protein